VYVKNNSKRFDLNNFKKEGGTGKVSNHARIGRDQTIGKKPEHEHPCLALGGKGTREKKPLGFWSRRGTGGTNSHRGWRNIVCSSTEEEGAP